MKVILIKLATKDKRIWIYRINKQQTTISSNQIYQSLKAREQKTNLL